MRRMIYILAAAMIFFAVDANAGSSTEHRATPSLRVLRVMEHILRPVTM